MATNATIVQRLNELIDIKKGEEHGTTISQCLGILNELESGSSADNEETRALSTDAEMAGPDAKEPETVADDEE